MDVQTDTKDALAIEEIDVKAEETEAEAAPEAVDDAPADPAPEEEK